MEPPRRGVAEGVRDEVLEHALDEADVRAVRTVAARSNRRSARRPAPEPRSWNSCTTSCTSSGSENASNSGRISLASSLASSKSSPTRVAQPLAVPKRHRQMLAALLVGELTFFERRAFRDSHGATRAGCVRSCDTFATISRRSASVRSSLIHLLADHVRHVVERAREHVDLVAVTTSAAHPSPTSRVWKRSIFRARPIQTVASTNETTPSPTIADEDEREQREPGAPKRRM